MIKTKLSIFIFFLTPLFINAQSMKSEKVQRNFYFGVGAGLDYGGFGCKLEFLPSKQVGFTFGGGYNLNGISYNVGTNIKLTPNHSQSPTLIALYGYNAVIEFYNTTKTYFGATFGVGYDYEVGKNGNKFSLAVLVPVRSESFKNDINSFPQGNRPKYSKILFSIGYNIAGSTRKTKKG